MRNVFVCVCALCLCKRAKVHAFVVWLTFASVVHVIKYCWPRIAYTIFTDVSSFYISRRNCFFFSFIPFKNWTHAAKSAMMQRYVFALTDDDDVVGWLMRWHASFQTDIKWTIKILLILCPMSMENVRECVTLKTQQDMEKAILRGGGDGDGGDVRRLLLLNKPWMTSFHTASQTDK